MFLRKLVEMKTYENCFTVPVLHSFAVNILYFPPLIVKLTSARTNLIPRFGAMIATMGKAGMGSCCLYR